VRSAVTKADLPSPDTKRWTARHKAAVLRAIEAGLLTREQVMLRYSMSSEELVEWERRWAYDGARALKVTRRPPSWV